MTRDSMGPDNDVLFPHQGSTSKPITEATHISDLHCGYNLLAASEALLKSLFYVQLSQTRAAAEN